MITQKIITIPQSSRTIIYHVLSPYYILYHVLLTSALIFRVVGKFNLNLAKIVVL